MNYCYSIECDENGDVLRDICTDEYGNKEVIYDIEEKNSIINKFNFSNMIKEIVLGLKLQLTVNKTLYEDGKISKELYERIENLILERVKPFGKYIEEF